MEKGTITRKLDFVLNGLDRGFTALYCREDFEREIWLLNKAEGKSSRPSILANLFMMLDACGIPYEKGRENAYYQGLVERSDIPDISEIEDRMLIALYTKYREYPSPDEYMQRIVDRLSDREDGWDEKTLRIRILKQFIKYGNYLNDLIDSNGKKIVGGKKEIQNYVKQKLELKRSPTEAEVLYNLDDGVFLKLEEIEDAKGRVAGMQDATKREKEKIREQNKAYGKLSGKYGLLKIADDLATGKFRTEGRTKRCLYWFAMVYGMTYYSGKPGQSFDSKSDIEKNLFQDYYTNNLLRFISDAYKGRLREYEIDPSGQGINFRNFAEVINLYFIANAYSPQEKLKRSAEMINRVQGKQFEQKKIWETRKETVFFRGLFRADAGESMLFQEDMLNLPEMEFERFICENYDCNPYIGAEDGRAERKVGELQVEIEQNTAFENYKVLLNKMEALGIELENCNYGLWITDVSAFKKKGYETICDRRSDIDRKKFEEFMELLLGINNFLGYTVSEEVSAQNKAQEWEEASRMKTRALFVKKPEAITRTSMIVAYYYYYNAVHEEDGKGKWKNFGEVFRSFKKGVDEILTQSFYQPLSGKNIFDILVVFSSYAYLNL